MFVVVIRCCSRASCALILFRFEVINHDRHRTYLSREWKHRSKSIHATHSTWHNGTYTFEDMKRNLKRISGHAEQVSVCVSVCSFSARMTIVFRVKCAFRYYLYAQTGNNNIGPVIECFSIRLMSIHDPFLVDAICTLQNV